MTRADRRKFHFIYKTTCIETGKWYIGMHSTDDMNDGYMGSGRKLYASFEKWKNSRVGKKNSELHRQRMSESQKGRPKTEEQKRKISETLRGSKLSIETCEKISSCLKGREPWNKGKTEDPSHKSSQETEEGLRP